ncbi:MAG TPA: hypothetical protein VMU27_03370 [Candidatus Paceibacterota bacterium]|nr:hypothetical protein [Candidatus Paceibacterota bacterium]
MSAIRGFTLIEAIVVTGLLALIGACTASVNLSTYEHASVQKERQSLVEALEHARAEALERICEGEECVSGALHGVSIQRDRYVIFQGSSYASRDVGADEIIEANPAFSHTGLSEVIFASSTGETNTSGAITITDTTGHTSAVTMGREGQIDFQ